MNKSDTKFSIVLVADSHNPTILNPDFLIRNEIVPKDWIVDQNQAVLTTPAFSQFRYLSGVSFTLDPNKLIIQDNLPEGEIFPVPEIALSYLKNVPHVKYYALGINFDKSLVFDSEEEARNFQREVFLKEGPWSMNGALSEFVAKFIYVFDECKCNLTFSSPVRLRSDPEDQKHLDTLILSANFHHDFKKIKKHEDRNTAIALSISDWGKDKEIFNSLTNKLTGGE